MKLTRAAFFRRPESLRRTFGRPAVLRIHPGTGHSVIEPVELVERLLPADCEHDMLRVTRAGLFSGRYLARCLDCGIGGPAVPVGTDDGETRRIAIDAFFDAHERAGFRWVTAPDGRRLGWVERMGDVWHVHADDSPRVFLGGSTTPEAGIRQVLRYWRMEPKPLPRPGCAHCGADPLEVVDFCKHCIRPVCEPCKGSSAYACVRQEVAS